MDAIRYLEDLEDVISEVERQLEARKAGRLGVGTVDQLSYIRDELISLREQICRGNIPPEPRPRLASSWIVTDSWPLDDHLGAQICKLDNMWRGLD